MSVPTVLIVDDDPEIVSALRRGLRLHGYDTLAERSVALALERFRDDQVSAAIVDMLIGLESGMDLVRAARAEGNTKPVLMLSALSEVEDRASGLAAGANDYIVKPFAFEELFARLRVQERRSGGLGPSPGIRLDPDSRSVTVPRRQVVLTRREFELLGKLYDQRGQVLSRGEIFDDLWAGHGTSSENIVDVYIGYLRRKLAPISDFGIEIKTIRNRGFVLNVLRGP